MGKLSTLTDFLLKPGCEDYSFVDQATADFEQGMDAILTDSTNMPELDASLDGADAMPSAVSSAIPHLVSTVSDASRLQLAPSIKSQKLLCQASDLPLPVLKAGKMSASG